MGISARASARWVLSSALAMLCLCCCSGDRLGRPSGSVSPVSIEQSTLEYPDLDFFYEPTVLVAGYELWVSPDKLGTLVLLPSDVPTSMIRLGYQQGPPSIGGEPLANVAALDEPRVRIFDGGTTVVWWRVQPGVFAVVTFSRGFPIDDVRKFINGLRRNDADDWPAFAERYRKLAPGSF